MVARATLRRVASSSIILVASIAAIPSCKTLPLPGAPDESLVVFLTDLTRDSWLVGGAPAYAQGGVLEVTNTKTHRDCRVAVALGKGYGAMALPAGQYVLSSLTLTVSSKEQNRQERVSLYGVFYVVERTVQVSTRGVKVYVVAGKGYLVGFFSTAGDDEAEWREGVQAELQRDRRWTAWEEYQLVNFVQVAQ